MALQRNSYLVFLFFWILRSLAFRSFRFLNGPRQRRTMTPRHQAWNKKNRQHLLQAGLQQGNADINLLQAGLQQENVESTLLQTGLQQEHEDSNLLQAGLQQENVDSTLLQAGLQQENVQACN